jgi:hypothetical protein
MKKLPSVLSLFIVLATGCCDCDELQSDEELRKLIIGTWVQQGCSFPFEDSKEITANSLLLEQMSFHADGRITEGGLYSYCCSSNCDSVNQGPCTWAIESGKLIIIPDSTAYSSHLNQWYPIKCLDGDALVFDNVVVGALERTKTCFRKQ